MQNLVGGRAIGQPLRRREDRPLLTGAGGYVEDLACRRDGVLHVAFVRSPFPSARIRAVDTAAAAAVPGVVRVISGAEVAQLGSLPLPGAPFLPGFPSAPHHPILAHG